MARRTILDAVRLAARRLFRVSAVDRTISSTGEAFFQLDNIHAAAQDGASLSAAALPSAQNRQTEEAALFPGVQQTEAERIVQRETPFSMAGTEKPSALLREASNLVKPSSEARTSPATAALRAEELIEKQRTGTVLWQGAAPAAKALLSTKILYPVENTGPEKKEGENGVLHAAEILMANQEQSATVSTWNRTPVVRASQADFSGIAAVEAADSAAAQRQAVRTGTADSAAARRQAVSTGTADSAAALWQAVSTGMADSAAALWQAVRTGTADSAAALRQAVSTGTTDSAAALRQAVSTGSLSTRERTEDSSALSTGTILVVENPPALSSLPIIRQTTTDNGRVLLPQPAGEETLSAVPCPAQKTAIAPAAGEPAARSSPTVQQKEAAPPAEEFWEQWTRRFAGELHSSPEGVHG